MRYLKHEEIYNLVAEVLLPWLGWFPMKIKAIPSPGTAVFAQEDPALNRTQDFSINWVEQWTRLRPHDPASSSSPLVKFVEQNVT